MTTDDRVTHYECTYIPTEYTGRIFRVGGIYKSFDNLNTPAVIDELGHVRVIGSNLRFLVGNRPGNLSPYIEVPIFADFSPATAGNIVQSPQILNNGLT